MAGLSGLADQPTACSFALYSQRGCQTELAAAKRPAAAAASTAKSAASVAVSHAIDAGAHRVWLSATIAAVAAAAIHSAAKLRTQMGISAGLVMVVVTRAATVVATGATRTAGTAALLAVAVTARVATRHAIARSTWWARIAIAARLLGFT